MENNRNNGNPVPKEKAEKEPVRSTGETADAKQVGYCIYCGMQLLENARFCMGCGKPVTHQMRNDGWNIQPQEQGAEAFDGEKDDGWHQESLLWKEMKNARYFLYQGYGHMDAIRAIKHICNLFFQYLREEEGYSIGFSGEDARIEYKLKSQI